MNFHAFIADYLLILITMAVILYIANEIVKLWDSVHIMMVTARVKKISRVRNRGGQVPPKPAPRSLAERREAVLADPIIEPEEPVKKDKWAGQRIKKEPRPGPRPALPSFKFQWKYVGYVAGALVVILILWAGIGILMYDPSGGRG